LPVRHRDDSCDFARAARRSLPRPDVAPDGDHGAVMADAATAVRADIAIRALGRTDCATTWRAMQAFTGARSDATSDEIWLTAPPPVYTLGLAGRREHLLRDNGIPVLAIDRGGQVTYHGPGQLVAYLMIDLRRRGLGIRAMVRAIETAVVEWLASVRIRAYGKPSAPGVYVKLAAGEAKIAALGLRVKNGCTYHAVPLNVPIDLPPFHPIHPS